MDLDTFREDLLEQGYSPETVRAYLKVLRRVQTKGVESTLKRTGSRSHRTITVAALKKYAGWVGGDEAQAILDSLRSLPRHRYRDPAPERPLNDEEWRRLLSAIEQEQPPLREILTLLCRTGLRIGDIGRIERDHVLGAVDDGVLYLIQKGGNYRPYPAKSIKDTLGSLLNHRWGQLWEAVSQTSERAYYMATTRALKRAAREAGLDPKEVHPHLLRKTVATQLLRSTGGNLVAVQKLLGHANVTTTQRYVAFTDVDELSDLMDALDERRNPNE